MIKHHYMINSIHKLPKYQHFTISGREPLERSGVGGGKGVLCTDLKIRNLKHYITRHSNKQHRDERRILDLRCLSRSNTGSEEISGSAVMDRVGRSGSSGKLAAETW